MPRTKKDSHDFQNKLVLNQWLISLFGIDPFIEYQVNGQSRRPFHRLKDDLIRPPGDPKEGRDQDGLHYFYHNLARSGLLKREAADLTNDELLRYEEGIGTVTRKVMEAERDFEWKYFQWLCLLFTEIYLERYFHGREQLLDDLNEFVDCFNSHWTAYEDIPPYDEDDLNKVCVQMATGSGKTLLMHAQLMQFQRYAEDAGADGDFPRALLVTPNERLSGQHIEEVQSTQDLRAADFAVEGDSLFGQPGGLDRLDVIDVHKLRDEEGEKTIATRTLGDRNLLLVDEGHRGMSGSTSQGKELGAWMRRRQQLAERGFTFEYSATFAQAVGASGSSEVENDYAKSVLFDYAYRWFYEDGYGKDYKIDNLPDPNPEVLKQVRETGNPKTVERLQQTKTVADALRPKFMTAALLKFYQQLRIYEEKFEGRGGRYEKFNLEKPLWVFVGSRVTSGYGKGERMSDVANVLRFLADFLADGVDGAAYVSYINQLIDQDGSATGLIDKDGRDVFDDAFGFLSEKRAAGETPQDIYQDILERLFHNRAGGTLNLERLTGESGEVVLRVGAADEPFGLINVSDAKGLCDHVETSIDQDEVPLTVTTSEFNEPEFEKVRDSDSSYNLLLGSRRFTEGWDCWRVSTLGLMNIGKSEGAQIIQLFGRGVRLKGYDWSLKRSGHVDTEGAPPDWTSELETLNVFGIEANYMEQFQQVLADEGLPGNEERKQVRVPLNVTHDFGKNLKILRPKSKDADGQPYDFETDGPVPSVGEIPDYFDDHTVKVDYYPRIEAITSRTRTEAHDKNEESLGAKQLALLDFDDLYFELEQFKAEREWSNLNVTKEGIRTVLQDSSWYELKIPSNEVTPSSFRGIDRLQRVALELLKRYTERLYKYRKRAFVEPRLEAYELTREDDNIPETNHYTITVDAEKEQLVQHIQRFANRIDSDDPPVSPFKGIYHSRPDEHLFEPILHVERGSDLTIRPVSLNKGEFKFVEDLKDWCEEHEAQIEAKDVEVYLLRNLSRGKGVGFFEAGNFHPDFIMWLLKGSEQYVTFVDPHGLVHTGPGDSKIELAHDIKNVEERLENPNITLNSFIISPPSTGQQDLNWGKEDSWFQENNLLFMDNDDYIQKLLDTLEIFESAALNS
jgi:hypothetical protein